ncbi:hypothetical protein [Accumulibacter sp.]|uniref:hypothetical protein n=1 Tax=Accumulibacter sp. TaxID=2053492 RepID=UPI00262C4AE7|nr:hypothetical protein [Accumulibacter sp.]
MGHPATAGRAGGRRLRAAVRQFVRRLPVARPASLLPPLPKSKRRQCTSIADPPAKACISMQIPDNAGIAAGSPSAG